MSEEHDPFAHISTKEDRDMFDRLAGELMAAFIKENGNSYYTLNLAHCLEAADRAMLERAYRLGTIKRPVDPKPLDVCGLCGKNYQNYQNYLICNCPQEERTHE